jgi:hypothetical protein
MDDGRPLLSDDRPFGTRTNEQQSDEGRMKDRGPTASLGRGTHVCARRTLTDMWYYKDQKDQDVVV